MIYRSADGVCIFYGDQEEATSVTPGQWDDSELVAKTRSFACPARACRARIFPSVSHATSSFKGLRRDAHFGGPARHGIGFGKTEKTSRHTRALWRGNNETGTSCERHKKTEITFVLPPVQRLYCIVFVEQVFHRVYKEGHSNQVSFLCG
jgi:hypothetical protein